MEEQFKPWEEMVTYKTNYNMVINMNLTCQKPTKPIWNCYNIQINSM